MISFERKGEQIDQAPLKLKTESASSKYKYNHHFDKEDLEEFQCLYPSIYPHPYDYEVNALAESMRNAFRYLIETGQLDKTYHLEDKTVAVKYIWITEK